MIRKFTIVLLSLLAFSSFPCRAGIRIEEQRDILSLSNYKVAIRFDFGKCTYQISDVTTGKVVLNDAFLDERNLGESGRPCLDLTAGLVDTQRNWTDANTFVPAMVTIGGLRWYKNRTVFNYFPDTKTMHNTTKEQWTKKYQGDFGRSRSQSQN